MLQEQSRLFQRLLSLADLVLVALCWLLAYWIRFEVLTPPEWLPLERYTALLPLVIIVAASVFWSTGLYAPDRAQRLSRLALSIAKSVALGLLVLTAALSFYRTLDFNFSRLMIILFGALTPLSMILLRAIVYAVIRARRRRGLSTRRVLIVGAGHLGRRLEDAFRQYPWMGLQVVGFLDDDKTGPRILGTTEQIADVMDQFFADGQRIDYVYIALPLTASERVEHTLAVCAPRLAHVCLVPDVFQFDIINSRITDVEGMPVIHLLDEAPQDGRLILKRVTDIAFSLLFLLLISPLLLVIAIAVKLSSPGPVFYQQERMGLNGHTFHMLKFRSMPVTAEKSSGPVWAKSGENRATRVGAFLRRTSLDELPQFINVLKGDMSVVGPRPERPFFIEQFKDDIPRYMLRHKMKAGITGWAQIHGWRGNTSLEKRIEFDLYYIQNWSLMLDLKIILLTPLKGLVNENAY
ncbi:MAG: undecaprenyl-phosphate glucose phosphotransferase [Bacteroidota bacterium]